MAPLLTVVVLAVVFTAALAVVQGAYWAWIAKQEQAKKDLARRLGMLDDEQKMDSLFREQARDAAAQALGSVGAHLQDTIQAAAIELTVGQLLTRMGGAWGVGFVLGALILGPMRGLALGFLAALVPYLIVRRAGTKRSRMLVEQLPDSLDLIGRSLQAGVGLNDTFRMVAEEMPLPVAEEFGRVFEEVRFGRDFRDAAEGMIRRNPHVFDMRLFVSSVLLARETGGNLIEILDNIANTIRNRFVFKAKVSALTSEARFSALVLGGLPIAVAIMVWFMNPDYLTPLFTESLGNVLLGISGTSYAIGIFMMKKMSDVEV